VEIEEELCRYPAISPDSGGEGELDKCEALERLLKKNGITDLKRIDVPDRRAKGGVRPNLIAEIGGGPEGDGEEGVFWIISHLDVVPPGETGLWNSDPWKALVKDGKIYGRGTEDNQQGIAASIIAALAFIRNGIKPARTIRLLFAADEECGSAYGIIPLSKQNLFNKADFALIPDGGDASGETIEIAEKNLLWLKCKTTGKQTHGSRPDEGSNAFLAGSELAFRLHNELGEKFSRTDRLFEPPYSTFQPTKKEANVPNINTIPGEDIFYMDMRILPCYPVSEVLAEAGRIKSSVEEKRNVKIRLEVMQRNESKATPADSPLVRLLSEKVGAVPGRRTRLIGIGGGTVAAVLRNMDIDCVVWSPLDDMAHNPNEYAVIKNILDSAKVMAAVAAGQ